MNIRLPILAAVLVVVSTNSFSAEVYVGILVPFRAPTSDGSGVATITLSDDHAVVDYVITYQNLTSPEVFAHIHHADGTIAFNLDIGNPKVGQWLDPPADDIVELRNEEMYINIHTEVYPVGELRGTLYRQTVPVTSSTWGAIKALYR